MNDLEILLIESEYYGLIILLLEVILIVSGLILLAKGPTPRKTEVFLACCLLPILIGFVGYFDFRHVLTTHMESGQELLNLDYEHRFREKIYTPMVFAGLATPIPFLLSVFMLIRVRLTGR